MNAIDLIGETREPQKISQEEFDASVERAVYKPFSFPGTVSLCFCRRCGSYGEITKEYAKSLRLILNQESEIDFNNVKTLRMHYFVTSSCEICLHEDVPIFAEIHKIDFKA